MAKRGRTEVDPNEKITLVRLWVKKSTINTLGEDNIKQHCAKTIETMLNNLK